MSLARAGWRRRGPAVTALGQATTRLLVDPVLAVVFPSSCPACGRTSISPPAGPLCDALLGRAAAPPRRRSAAAASRCRAGARRRAAAAAAGSGSVRAGASLGPYEGTLRVRVHELKYHARRRVAARLAEALLASRGRAGGPGRRRTCSCRCPLHPRRRRERGFNQAELLARELAPPDGPARGATDALVRRKDTPPQTGLSRRAAARQRRRRVRREAAACGGGPDRGTGGRRAHHRRHRPRLRARPRAGGGGPRCGW